MNQKIATITLNNMEFYAFHGCYREEQMVGNRFRADLTFTVDARTASQSDSIDDTISYLDVYQLVREQMMITSHILEHVASRTLDQLKKQYPQMLSATIKIAKLTPPLGGQVEGVSIEMSF